MCQRPERLFVVVHQQVQVGERADADGQTVVAVQGLPENTRVLSGALGPLREGTPVTLTGGGK